MKLKIAISIALGISIVGCSETIPNRNNTSHKPSDNTKIFHANPILVSLDELEKKDYSSVLSVNGNTAILLNDKYSNYDSAVSRLNRSISSRSNGTITINTTGESLLSQRIEYDMATGEVKNYQHYEYDPATNKRIKRTRYNSAGIDNTWFNEDDVVQDYSTYDELKGTIQTLSIRVTGAGVDDTWFTEDDLVESYEAELHAADGTTVIGVASHSDPGVDLSWFTDDDVMKSLTEDIIEPDGSEHWVMFTDSGADGDWTTLEDNTVGNFASTLFNADNLETKHIFYGDVGVDLTPFTEDDIPLYYHTYTHNADKLESNKLRYNGPGLDTKWLTADDDIEECEETSFTAENRIDLEVDTKVGTDNLCFTGDDTTVDYNTFTYDATGHLTDEHVFADPGPDGKWHTDDDLLSREYVFTPL